MVSWQFTDKRGVHRKSRIADDAQTFIRENIKIRSQGYYLFTVEHHRQRNDENNTETFLAYCSLDKKAYYKIWTECIDGRDANASVL